MVFLNCSDLPAAGLSYSNNVYVNESDVESFGSGEGRISIQNIVFRYTCDDRINPGMVGLNSLQRGFLNAELDKPLEVKRFVCPKDESIYLETVGVEIRLVKERPGQPIPIDCKVLIEELKGVFGSQLFFKGMVIAHKYGGKISCKIKIVELEHVPKVNQEKEIGDNEDDPIIRSIRAGSGGVFTENSHIKFTKWGETNIQLKGQAVKKSASRMIDTDFEKLGIGGLNKEFGDIFRRAFVSRILPPEVVQKLGIKHVRGLMLFGPPGCGKTLIARQISKVLQGSESAREPKIVSGPEVLSKFVGETEKNVRELFSDAEAEQAEAGEDSELHVIIFDEIDAICKQRGTKRDGTGVGDSLVNQLLAKIDGVNSLDNVLLIGMTNRLDMIDTALLRPGRFEVQIEIGLPNEIGRTQILNIHTKSMREGNCMGEDVDIKHLAKNTKNFSGAEIEGLVKSAVSFATQRHVNTDNLTELMNTDKIVITGDDFEGALSEVHPAFGIQEEDALKGFYRNGIIPFSDGFNHLYKTLQALSVQAQTSARTPLLSVLLKGEKGSGKTALVAKIATEAGFAFTKFITADALIGMTENQKCSYIAEIFENAYKSPQSLIVLDDLERLIGFVPIGPGFSNLVLQALLVLINKPPPKEERKLMILATISTQPILEQLGLIQVFNVDLPIPLVETPDQVQSIINGICNTTLEGETKLVVDSNQLEMITQSCRLPIPVKDLFVIVEMARQGVSELTYDSFMECHHSILK